jgi:hypothetical protein
VGLIEDRERTLATDHPARKRARLEVLRRFDALSWQDQYKTYKYIQGHFIHSGSSSEAWREVQQRAECVEAVIKAAEHLGLAEGEAPGIHEYERARRELGLTLSSATIIRRWVAWREVAKAARGEKVSLTARQRAHLRAVIRTRPNREEWLFGLREWLETRPPKTATPADYDAWAEERNERSPDMPHLPSANSIRCALALTWTFARKVAEGNLSLVDAQAQHLQHLKDEGGGFAGVSIISLLYETTTGRGKGITRKPDFPPPAFELGRSQQAWLLTDIEAHRKGHPFPDRELGWLQEQVLNSTQLSKVLGLTRAQLANAIHREKLDIAPPPAGQVTGLHFWWRRDFEKWAAEQPMPIPTGP